MSGVAVVTVAMLAGGWFLDNRTEDVRQACRQGGGKKRSYRGKTRTAMNCPSKRRACGKGCK